MTGHSEQDSHGAPLSAVGGDEMTRRRFIAVGAKGVAVVVGGGTFLSAGGAAASHILGTGVKPKRGGTITLGMLTGGSAETLNPKFAISNPDLARIPNLYNTLFRAGEDIKTLVPLLATRAESNKQATVWTLHLRDGVTWHDGKPFTADDVIYTLRSWADPTHLAHGLFAGTLDFRRIRKTGRLAVELPLHAASAQFPSLFTFYNTAIVQDGAKDASLKSHPIGTGPFKYVSFTPGQQSVFEANRNYWEEGGRPYVDRLVINSSFTDEVARINALVSGQVNVLGAIPGAIARQAAAGKKVRVQSSHSGDSYQINCRLDRPPFNDNRVRQALRFIPDRPAIIEGALNGYGKVADDLAGAYTEYYASDLKRPQDIDKAKSLLKAAGHEGMTLTLPVANAAPGLVECATVFAQQAKQAGLNIVVQQVPTSTYFSPSGGYTTRTFGFDVSASTLPTLSLIYGVAYTATAQYNDAKWGLQPKGHPGDRADSDLILRAIGQPNHAKAQELWREVQLRQFNYGGVMVFANADYVDATALNVHGLRTTPVGYLNNWRLLDGWIE